MGQTFEGTPEVAVWAGEGFFVAVFAVVTCQVRLDLEAALTDETDVRCVTGVRAQVLSQTL